MLISDLQIADKHHNIAKFKEQKEKEMSDADMASRASCCVSSCLSSCQLRRCSATCRRACAARHAAPAKMAATSGAPSPSIATQYSDFTRTSSHPGYCYSYGSTQKIVVS